MMSVGNNVSLSDPADPDQVLCAAVEYELHVDGFALGSAISLPEGFVPNTERLEQLKQFLIGACGIFGASDDMLKRRHRSHAVHIIAGEDVEELRCLAESERAYRRAMDELTPGDAPNQPARRLCGALRTLRSSATQLLSMIRERRNGHDFYDPEAAMLFDCAFDRAADLNRDIGTDLAYGLPNPGHLETQISLYLDDLGQAAKEAMRPFRANGWSSRECIFHGGDLASIWMEEDDLLKTEQLLPRSEKLERVLALVAVPHASNTPLIESIVQSVKTYDCFISHASEDKKEFVRPLAVALQKLGVKVWYDEFELKIGDSLRQSIDKGLGNSRYGVVVLSQSFFAKKWPQYELDGMVAREMNGAKVILPIWHRVTKQEVTKFSSTLADRVAIDSTKGVPMIVAELAKAVLDTENQ